MPLRTVVMPGYYQDSVVLMRISAQVRANTAVREVALFMGTPANQALLEQAGLASDEGRRAGPNDLIVTVSADDAGSADDAIATVQGMLLETSKARGGSTEYRPHSLESALRAMPDANVAAISVPGAYAKAEAMSALRRNLHVFVFSDNVPIADEIELKREAVRRRRFCMGPDQGTAYLGGTGLGFANVVARGRVGCISASGTGLQAVACRLDALGEGISHAIGVGGRDLSEPVGGLMTLFALEALTDDPSTEAIVLISKPPHPSVLGRIEAALERIAKPTVLCCIGTEPRRSGRAVRVETLDEAADAAVALLSGSRWEGRPVAGATAAAMDVAGPGDASLRGRRIEALYTGGTLAYETSHLLRSLLGDDHPHRVLDLGDDRYTVGRPHPMIDPRTRSEMIVAAVRDPEVGVLLVDLVLGKGAHENPAAPLAVAVEEALRIAARDGRQLAVVATVIGTARDPQGLAAQTDLLERARIRVCPSNAVAARTAAMLVAPHSISELTRRVA